MTLIADVFRKLRTPKNLVRSMFKMSRLKRTFRKAGWKTGPNIVEI